MMRSARSPTSASSAVSSSDTSSGSSSLRGSVIVGHRVLGSQLLLLAPPTRAWPQAPLGACPQYLQPALVTNAGAEGWLNSRRLGSGGVWRDNGRKRLIEQARDRQRGQDVALLLGRHGKLGSPRRCAQALVRRAVVVRVVERAVTDVVERPLRLQHPPRVQRQATAVREEVGPHR